MLKSQNEGVNAANKILNVVLVPQDVATGDAPVHLLPGKMKLLIARFDVIRHIPAAQFLQGGRAQRLLPCLAVLRERRLARSIS